MMGHVPAGHLVDADGARTFLMLGIVLDGLPHLNEGGDVAEFAWLTRQELLQAYADDTAAHAKLSLLLVE